MTLHDGVLALKGEKKSEREEKKDDYHLMERSYGSFQRSFRVSHWKELRARSNGYRDPVLYQNREEKRRLFVRGG